MSTYKRTSTQQNWDGTKKTIYLVDKTFLGVLKHKLLKNVYKFQTIEQSEHRLVTLSRWVGEVTSFEIFFLKCCNL